MSIGGPEIILIFIVALIVFGPKKLPEIGVKIGRVLGEIRRATGELRSSVEREIGVDPLDGVQQIGRARRDIIGSISEPIREAAKGSLLAARQAPQEALGTVLRDVREVVPEEPPAEGPDRESPKE